MREDERCAIAVVCPSCGGNGSVANVAQRGAAELARYFTEVRLLSESFPEESSRGGVTRELVRSRSYIWLRRFGHVPRERSFCHAVAARLSRIASAGRLQATLCHGHPAAALAGAVVKQRYGIPLAMIVHGDIFERPACTYGPLLTRFYKRVTPIAYSVADLVIVLSPAMREWALRGGAREEAVRVIPNGIDPEEIGLNGNEVRGVSCVAESLRILYVGTLAPIKGIEILLEACVELAHKNVPFSVTIVGTGSLAGKLQRYAEDAELGDRVRFLGSVPRRQLGEIYRAADVLCLPSLSDPLPTVALEALCSGTPVVGAAVGGIPSMVKDGGNGALFPPGDVSALAHILVALAGDRPRLAQLARGARSSVLPRFSWLRVAEELAEALAGIGHEVRKSRVSC